MVLFFQNLLFKEDFEGTITVFSDKAQKDRPFVIMVVSEKIRGLFVWDTKGYWSDDTGLAENIGIVHGHKKKVIQILIKI